MKLAISTLPFRSWTLEDMLDLCGRGGYDAVEIRMDYHAWSDRTLDDAHYRSVRSSLRARGMQVSDLGSGIVLHEYSGPALEELRRLFQIAGILQAGGVRIMLGSSRNTTDIVVPDPDLPGIRRWLADADALAASLHSEIWIETHNEFSSARSLHRLISEGGYRHVRVIWDIMHPLEVGETVGETAGLLHGILAHVHIKDGRPWNDSHYLRWKYTRIGAGDIPIREIVTALERSGYDGFYSLEWESSWREELRELDCDREEILSFPRFMRSLQNV